MYLVGELLFHTVSRLLVVIFIDLFICFSLVGLLDFSVARVGASSASLDPVVAEKFSMTLRYVPEYIKDVGDSVDSVFINNFDFTQQHKKCFETQIGRKGEGERRCRSPALVSGPQRFAEGFESPCTLSSLYTGSVRPTLPHNI